ncbi:MAG: ATPase, T2SS/T4P/T4SS family, partial [Candidatus Omnitrophica bacterium]|nr:ATPase, T2SS/T4P/T4SS family [Candidatus Omnitrophota bacterium]
MLKRYDLVLYEALLEKGMITREALEPCAAESERSGEALARILAKRSLLSEKDALVILAEKLKLPLVDLRRTAIDKKVIDKIPAKVAIYYRFVPLGIKERTFTIAVSYPLDIKVQDEIRTQLGHDIETALSTSDDIEEALKKYYGAMAETLEGIASKTPQGRAVTAGEDHGESIEDLEKMAGNASVIKLVNQIIIDAYRRRATDIHLEPYRQSVALRYRIDGIMYEANVPREIMNFLSAIISRIKIMSNLNIVERRLPQDGRAVVKVQDQTLDLRISTMPTPHGESVVIRILPTQMLFSLEKLGLLKHELRVFETMIQKPHGIIFVTGPTGSGKTTTLYTCLSRINTKERKIITIEDPIEYEIPGITQIQVMPEIGLDFARGLRSILRHDPDVIMVGEVRDLETAEIAIRVALTGHLVFSTLHTNDAPSAITRLIDIGVEPYLIASSVEAFIAQRLIRVICEDCKYEDKSIPEELKAQIASDIGIKAADVKVFRGKGCVRCNDTGFFGRTAIYEILLLDDAIKDLVVKKVSSGVIKKAAISKGMRVLRQDGWRKVISGITTPEEVLNVTSTEEVSVPEEEPRIFSDSASPPEDSKMESLDKRAYERIKKKINIRFKVFKSKEDLAKSPARPEHMSVANDISAGGMRFVSSEAMPLGSILEL